MAREIKSLKESGLIESSNATSGFLSRIFLVPKSDGKMRQIFDLRRLNEYLNPRKFRLINQPQVLKFLQARDFMGKIDISQAYFHVPIKESHRRYLSFVFNDDLFQSLPFGLSNAPLAFSRLSNWVASIMRERGLHVIVYLDDFLFAHQNPEILKKQIEYAVDLLRNLGGCVN